MIGRRRRYHLRNHTHCLAKVDANWSSVADFPGVLSGACLLFIFCIFGVHVHVVQLCWICVSYAKFKKNVVCVLFEYPWRDRGREVTCTSPGQLM